MFKKILCFFLPIHLLAASLVEVGLDRFFKDHHEKLIFKKKIGILTNQTGRSSQGESTVDLFLREAKDYEVIALFSPEHGIDGQGYAWEKIQNSTYKKHIPIYSLHGATRRATPEMLRGIDVIIFDIQDIGTRTYTYGSTLFYLMEEAAKTGISVIVLDRPNPMGGHLVDGPMLENAFRSYIGYINIPYCHGMTLGELAHYFAAEYKVKCDLTVIPMSGWKRSMTYEQTGLQWIPTSPNIPESTTPFFAASTGILGELSLVNIGIGYTLPFKVVGAPWIDADRFADALNNQKLPGVHFLPFHYRPFYGSYKGKDCHGVKIQITDYALYRPLSVQYLLLGILKSLYPKEISSRLAAMPQTQKDLFNKANGNSTAMQSLIHDKFTAWKLINYQKEERDAFIHKRRKYLLY